MNKIWQKLTVVGLSTFLMISATSAFAQTNYFGGACEPAACEPTPVCEPAYEPTCGPTFARDGYYGFDYCAPGCNVVTLIDGALNVAVTPIHWVAALLTDGIYPDCGCAPAPARTSCNPCNICGNYVGGCNDYCETPSPAPCDGGYANGNYAAYDAAPYSIGAYDSETYDASPSRQNGAPVYQAPRTNGAAPETLPPEAINRNNYSANRPSNFDVRGLNVQTLVGNAPQASAVRAVRPVNYENRRVAQRPISPAEEAPIAVEQVAPNASNRPAARRTFGQTRPISTPQSAPNAR